MATGTGTAFLSANAFFALGLEATRGTAAATPTDIPVNGPAMTPMITWLKDAALRGSPVDEYDEVAGVRADDVDVKGYVYADSFPILVRGILGGADTKTGAGPTYTHTIGLANNATTASQPPSVTATLFDAANVFQIAAAQMVSLDITTGADKAMEWTAKMTGNPWSVLDEPPSTTWGTVSQIPPWNAVVSVAGTQVYFVETFDIKIDRKSAPIYTSGQQGPYVTFAGPIGVTGTLNCVVATATDPFSVGTPTQASTTAQGTPTFSVTITSGSNDTFTFTGGGGGATPETFVIPPGTYANIGALEAAVAAAVGSVSSEAFSTHCAVTNTAGALTFTMVGNGGAIDNGNTISTATHSALSALGFTGTATYSGGVNGTPSALTRDQVALVATFTDPAASGSVQFHMNDVQFSQPKRTVGKIYTDISVEFTAIANTTDATAGGYSPLKIVVVNGVSTAFVGS